MKDEADGKFRIPDLLELLGERGCSKLERLEQSLVHKVMTKATSLHYRFQGKAIQFINTSHIKTVCLYLYITALFAMEVK